MRNTLVTVAAVATVLIGSSVFAHAKLVSTSPADGARLADAPVTLTLSFAEPVKLASVAISGAGHSVPIAVDRTAKATATVAVPLPALVPGRYDVRWSAVSPSDGHVTKGSLVFTIQPVAL